MSPIRLRPAALALAIVWPAACAHAPDAPDAPLSATAGRPMAVRTTARVTTDAVRGLCLVDLEAPHGLREVRRPTEVIGGDTLVVGSPEWEASLAPVTVLRDMADYTPGEPVYLGEGEPDQVLIAHPVDEPGPVPADRLTLLGTGYAGLPVYVDREAVGAGLDTLVALHADGALPLEEVASRPAGREILDATVRVHLPVRRTGCVFVPAMLEREYIAYAAAPSFEEEVSFPPAPSAHLLVSLGDFSRAQTVGGAARELHDRLVATGHGNILFVPVPGGLAVVGAAPEGAAMSAPAAEAEDRPLLASVFSSVAGLARSLFQGRPGEHRAIAFVLSTETWRVDAGGSEWADMTGWEAGGGLTPPAWYDTVAVTPAHQLVAALYVFRQPNVDDPPTLVLDPSFSVEAYLEDVGLRTPDPEEP